MIKAVKITYSENNKKLGTIWEIHEESKWVKTVFFEYKEESGKHHVCFYISQIEPRYAVVIDNGEWDLMCFALDYTPESVLNTCTRYMSDLVHAWLTAPDADSNIETFTFANEDELMEVIS